MSSPSLPLRQRPAQQREQLDLFRALPGEDMAPRDAQDLMAYPFFSLAKSRRTAPIDPQHQADHQQQHRHAVAQPLLEFTLEHVGVLLSGRPVRRRSIPVIPTVHYNMGGIPTNYHGEVVRKDGDNPDAVIPGLYAIGEAACVSVHGANRLGSNSLLDLVVFGRAVANRCAETIKPGASHKPLASDACDKALGLLDKLRHANGDTPTSVIRDRSHWHTDEQSIETRMYVYGWWFVEVNHIFNIHTYIRML